MSTLFVAIAAFFGYIVAYNLYGKWLAKKIYCLDDHRDTPSHTLQDDVDYAPTRSFVLMGHHFTTIAGTGPIVGPAIAVFWGWLPALLWVVFGSIFIGAVHDFSTLVISMRNDGKSIADIAKKLVSTRVRILFLLLLCFTLTLIVAVFCTITAGVFIKTPESVICVWGSLPLAMIIGYINYKLKGNIVIPALVGVVILYFLIWLGIRHPISLPESWGDPQKIWTYILLAYCFCASTLPVWLLLQPRDFINSCQLYVALAALIIGMVVISFLGKTDLIQATPAVVSVESLESDGITAEDPIIKTAQPILPWLFITIACGAISGFHAMVASGTTSKQINKETDALPIGYGSMLMEGVLAIIVILACTAGVAVIGKEDAKLEPATIAAENVKNALAADNAVAEQASTDTQAKALRANWLKSYNVSLTEIQNKAVPRFIEGGGRFLEAIGIPLSYAMTMMAVLVASFAATTLDSATRLQRYLIQELGVRNMYLATCIVVFFGAALACMPSPTGQGAIGMMLWPVFGATNQILASLTLSIIMIFVKRSGKPCYFLVIPLIIMTILPFWAMILNMVNWITTPGAPVCGPITNNHVLFAMGLAIVCIQLWILVECLYTLAHTVPQKVLDAKEPDAPNA
ncbi:MAG: carbon starvation protein A [Thermoguttaceae bacterium]|nr:carbon starvation protein A [Thermoguttaceae bacterium]